MGIPALPFSRLDEIAKKPKGNDYPEHPQTIGEHIRKKRMDKNMLQEEVATLFGTSTDCITNWENNRGTPQIRYFPSIITFLGYNPLQNPPDNFGNRIKLYRQTHGLSNKKLGKIIGVDGSTILSWERSGHIPNNSKAMKLMSMVSKDDC